MNKRMRKQVKRWIGYIALVCGIISMIFGVLYLIGYIKVASAEIAFDNSWIALIGIVPGYTGILATSTIILLYAIVDIVTGIVCFIIAYVLLRGRK